ncbi:MAG: 5'/3'-nucleotidase SurE, partial [Planctomycetota bacterium]
VDGRPADCVKLALSTLWRDRFGKGDRPDLIISGMNAGANVGINVIYSGTVAAAIEGAFLGIPAIAVSLHLGRGRPLFDVAAAHARRAIEKICAESVPGPHTCLNVNIPRCEESGTSYSQAQAEQAARIAGSALSDISRTPENEIGLDASDPHDPRAELPLAVCPMNAHGIIDRFEERTSPGGQSYYWAAGGGLDFHNTDAGTDVHQLFERRITVTPLHYDLTEYGAMHHWRERLE